MTATSMIAADRPIQRPHNAKLLVIDATGKISHVPRSRFVDLLRPHDLVVANDAATLPASFRGVHLPTGAAIEVRLARRNSLAPDDVHQFWAVVFGAGDFRMRTEDRPPPPALNPGDRLVLGSGQTSGDQFMATVDALLDHPRLISVRFDGSSDKVWAAFARYGTPIQYAHMPATLAMWDVWTPIAALPAAFEPPSAGFALDWQSIRAMRERGVLFSTITLAAGLSSTGDPDLDRRLPFDEPYRIPQATASAVRETRLKGGRVVAVGTTVVRALEHAWRNGSVRAGEGVADQRVTQTTRLLVVDAILSGTHEPESTHYQMLRAFVDDRILVNAGRQLEARGYRTHEFGDSVFVEKGGRSAGLLDLVLPPRTRPFPLEPIPIPCST